MLTLSRRGFLSSLIAAPAIVHITNIMPVKMLPPELRTFNAANLEPEISSGVLTIQQIVREFLAILRSNLTNASIESHLPTIIEPTKTRRGMHQLDIDLSINTHDRTLPLAEFSALYLLPAASAITYGISKRVNGRLLRVKKIKSRPLELPQVVDEGHTEISSDLSVRAITFYDMRTDRMITRFDTLFEVEQITADASRLLKLAGPRGHLPG